MSASAWNHFELCEAECKGLLDRYAELNRDEADAGEVVRGKLWVAYDLCLKCSVFSNIVNTQGGRFR